MRRIAVLGSTIIICTLLPLEMRAAPLTALKECIDSNIAGGSLNLTTVEVFTNGVVTGSDWVIRCDGEVARQLWNLLLPFRKSPLSTWIDHNKNQDEKLEIGNDSQCDRVVLTAAGAPGNAFWCDIDLDLTSDTKIQMK